MTFCRDFFTQMPAFIVSFTAKLDISRKKPSYYGIRVGVKGEEGKAAAQKYVQRRTAKNKMATKVFQKCMAFSCFYDKLQFQKSSNFLKNCNFKV